MWELARLGLKGLSYIAPFAVRWYYTPEKLANGLKIRVRGDGDGVTFECGELPQVRIWLLVSNLSPFNLRIDRAHIQVAYGAVICEVPYIRPCNVNASQEAEFLVQWPLSEAQLNYIRRNRAQSFETKLYVTAFVESRVHDFEAVKHVPTNNVRMVNLAPL